VGDLVSSSVIHGALIRRSWPIRKLRRSVMWLVTRLSKEGYFANVFFSNACNSLLSSQRFEIPFHLEAEFLHPTTFEEYVQART